MEKPSKGLLTYLLLLLVLGCSQFQSPKVLFTKSPTIPLIESYSLNLPPIPGCISSVALKLTYGKNSSGYSVKSCQHYNLQKGTYVTGSSTSCTGNIIPQSSTANFSGLGHFCSGPISLTNPSAVSMTCTGGLYDRYLGNYIYSRGTKSLVLTGQFCQIASANLPPTVTNPGSLTNVEGDNINFQIQASDPNGNGITFQATGLPNGLSIDPNSGIISGVVANGDANSSPYNVYVQVTDSFGASSIINFAWTINIPVVTYSPPVITQPANQINTEGNSVNLQIQATDPNGLVLNYSATGLPSGLTINSSTGLISGTITTGDSISSPYTAIVTVSDGKAPAASASFSWNVANTLVPAFAVSIVTNANGATVTTSGSVQGIRYSYDTSGGWINLPAPFNNPYTINIVWPNGTTFVCAQAQGTDGIWHGSSATDTQICNSVTTAPTTRSVTLSWNAVTQNADGTPITNLAGYIMYYTDVQGDWSRNTPIIVNAPTTTDQIANLIRGKTYYFAVSAFNTSNQESVKSVVVTYTIP